MSNTPHVFGFEVSVDLDTFNRSPILTDKMVKDKMKAALMAAIDDILPMVEWSYRIDQTRNMKIYKGHLTIIPPSNRLSEEALTIIELQTKGERNA